MKAILIQGADGSVSLYTTNPLDLVLIKESTDPQSNAGNQVDIDLVGGHKKTRAELKETLLGALGKTQESDKTQGGVNVKNTEVLSYLITL